MESEYKGVTVVYPQTTTEWRLWLEKHHQSVKSVWVLMFKKATEMPSITYKEALDEALCFGWIDSVSNKRDEQSFYQFFSKRNPKSNWSRVNKNKIEYLEQQGKMTDQGRYMVELAKQTGTWTALDLVEDLVVPDEMEKLLTKHPTARTHYEAFPRSVKRGILEWIYAAKTLETKLKRIQNTIELAEQNIRANQFNPK
jgi:uncharacterized protein YdeI (YjbR/CyaY-like superfamily)